MVNITFISASPSHLAARFAPLRARGTWVPGSRERGWGIERALTVRRKGATSARLMKVKVNIVKRSLERMKEGWCEEE